MELISEYYSEDMTKTAKLYLFGNVPHVEFFLNEELIGARTYDRNTYRYAEDAAENFVEGIMRVEDVLDTSRED